MNIGSQLLFLLLTAAAETEPAVYEGWAEAPGIVKYMVFSLIGIVVLAIIAGIYCAVTPPRRRKK